MAAEVKQNPTVVLHDDMNVSFPQSGKMMPWHPPPSLTLTPNPNLHVYSQSCVLIFKPSNSCTQHEHWPLRSYSIYAWNNEHTRACATSPTTHRERNMPKRTDAIVKWQDLLPCVLGAQCQTCGSAINHHTSKTLKTAVCTSLCVCVWVCGWRTNALSCDNRKKQAC